MRRSALAAACASLPHNGGSDLGSGATRPRRVAGRGPSKLSAADLEVVLAVEGRSPQTMEALAVRLKLDPAIVWRHLQDLRQREVLQTVTLVRLRRLPSWVESIAHIHVDWSHPEAADLEAALRDDPSVTQAARTLGPFDYSVFAVHPDPQAAARWVSVLRARPCVLRCRVDRAQTKFERFTFAAAILAPTKGP
jgi:DNA-binding Lrp family transcriptional regulator